MDDLKACPFGCVEPVAVHRIKAQFNIACPACRCAGPLAYSVEEAVSAWNRRPEPQGRLDRDVVRLVVAARKVAFGDLVLGADDDGCEAIRELDQASEAFASRVPWDDEPDDAALTPPEPSVGVGESGDQIQHADDCQSHIVDVRGRPDECTCGAEDREKANHDCLAKRRPGEPMFILLGRDPDAHNIVRMWAERRLVAGGDPEHCQMGVAKSERMKVYAADPANAPASAPPASAYPALQEQASGDGWRPTHRHVKRGTEYQKGERLIVQCESPIPDDTILVTYRDQEGQLWGRPPTEFNDGRFEALATPTQGKEKP